MLSTLWIAITAAGVKRGGQNGWQPLKAKYSNNSDTGLPLVESFKSIPIEYTIGNDHKEHSDVKVTVNGVTLDNKIETDHFFIQHFRIPRLNNPLTVVKILQIAYNAGQFQAEREKGTYPIAVTEFYDKYKFGELATYVDANLSPVWLDALAQQT